MDIMRTFLLPLGYEQLVAEGLKLAPAPYPFEPGDGFSPGTLVLKADSLASAECSLDRLLGRIRVLRALEAHVVMLEPHGLAALSFANPEYDPGRADLPGLTLQERRLKMAERFTLFIELHPKLMENLVKEPLVSIHFSFDGGALDALSALGYADHLFGPPDIDDEEF